MQHQFLVKGSNKTFNPCSFIKRLKSVLVIAEHNNNSITPTTRQVITAAKDIGGEINVLVAGPDCEAAAKSICNLKGLKTIFLAENNAFRDFPPENLTPLIVSLHKEFLFTHIVAGSTILGMGVLPRVAAKLNAPALTNVIQIKETDVFVKSYYTGNILMTVKVNDPVKVILVRHTDFPPCNLKKSTSIQEKLRLISMAMNIHKTHGTKDNRLNSNNYIRLQQAANSLTKWKESTGDCAVIKKIPDGSYNLNLTKVINSVAVSPKLNFSHAKIIICGGMGLTSKRDFKLLHVLAKELNAVVGATKLAVEEGIAPKEIYIGHTPINPDLCIAVGVSGNDRDIARIKQSKMIIVINKDPKAPIINIADYILIGDLFNLVPLLIKKLYKNRINKV